MAVRNCADIGPNLRKITKRLVANQNLLKLLYYSDKDPLNHPDLTKEQIEKEISEKLIKVIPRVGPKEGPHSVITLQVAKALKNLQNGEFKDLQVVIEVYVPMTQWFIKDENLRPFSILGAIQESLDGIKINGVGRLEGGDFKANFLTDEMSCYEQYFYLTSYD